jgi:hypothetical protein
LLPGHGALRDDASFADRLFEQFDLAGAPGLFEPRFKRAVEAEDHEPAFAGQGLNPVVHPPRIAMKQDFNMTSKQKSMSSTVSKKVEMNTRVQCWTLVHHQSAA